MTGGVPKYLDEINPKKTAEENIQELCFTESGALFNEFDRIFHDLFSKRSGMYKKIVKLLVESHSLNQQQICQGIHRQRGRAISEYLNDLVTAGFLTSDYSWDLKSKKISKLRKYRLSDSYLRFYLKFIEPRKVEISQGKYEEKSLFDFLNFESMVVISLVSSYTIDYSTNQPCIRRKKRSSTEEDKITFPEECTRPGNVFTTLLLTRRIDEPSFSL